MTATLGILIRNKKKISFKMCTVKPIGSEKLGIFCGQIEIIFPEITRWFIQFYWLWNGLGNGRNSKLFSFLESQMRCAMLKHNILYAPHHTKLLNGTCTKPLIKFNIFMSVWMEDSRGWNSCNSDRSGSSLVKKKKVTTATTTGIGCIVRIV